MSAPTTAGIFGHVVRVINIPDVPTLSFEVLKDKALLIVNVASRCGYTKQYAGLEALHRKYAGRGLAVVGFPCNQFGAQEPGTEDEIATFCSRSYAVSFPVAAKIDVNGPAQHPLYAQLKAAAGNGDDVRWNFEKFLVRRVGDAVQVERFSSRVTPEELDPKIDALLGA
ncbi:hypothetical protein HK405_015616 [Cladochytrium tenue]|nr:hypothetical protein HK405_015616 [Cladochytrium tenue]